jgi:glycerophosphoryl diester phosphodiesterase
VTSTAKRLVERDRPLIIGHRGYCALAPENTLPSFKLALEAGADLVECDYHHTKDGVPVVIHDSNLDRTTNAREQWKRRRIKVARKTAAEIQTLNAGNWFGAAFAGARVPLLSEALDFISGNGGVALIERKSGDAATLAMLLCDHELINRVVVISFDWKFLRELHALEPTLVLGALGPPSRLSNGRRPVHPRRRMETRLNDLAKTGAKIAVWNRKVSKRGIQSAHRRDVKVWIYTVDTLRVARQLLRRGADAIITNRISAVRPAPGAG